MPATSVTVPLGPALITFTDIVPPAVTETGPLLVVSGVATVPTVTSSTSSIVSGAPVPVTRPVTDSTLVRTVAPLRAASVRAFVVTSPAALPMIEPASAESVTAAGAVTGWLMIRSAPVATSDTVSVRLELKSPAVTGPLSVIFWATIDTEPSLVTAFSSVRSLDGRSITRSPAPVRVIPTVENWSRRASSGCSRAVQSRRRAESCATLPMVAIPVAVVPPPAGAEKITVGGTA